MGKSKELLRMFVPSATVFFSSGCIMILELVASRLVARDLGSSLYTWTSIIGIVLTGIAVGNYLGGRIADRHHARRTLAVLFGLASGACVGIIVVNNFVGNWVWLWRLSWPTHVFIHVLLVFFVPSTLLGTISSGGGQDGPRSGPGRPVAPSATSTPGEPPAASRGPFWPAST